jgi:hypothetical protein
MNTYGLVTIKNWAQQSKDNTTESKLEQSAENCVDLITMEELETTIKSLKPRKSPSSDGINNELYKHAPKWFIHKIFNFCWIYGYIPVEWRTVIVITIHEKTDRKNPDNYRGTSLLNTGYKIYSKIIAKGLTVIADVLLLEEQNGFRKCRSCMDCTLSASQMIEKHGEFNILTYISFFGFKNPLTQWKKKIMDYSVKQRNANTFNYSNSKTYKGNIIRVNACNGISEYSRISTQEMSQDCTLTCFV